MFITFITKNSEGSLDLIAVAMGISWAWGSLTIGVGWSSISSPSIGSSFKSKPKWISLFMPNLPTQPCCTQHQQSLSCQLHIFFNRHFFTSRTQRGMRLVNTFVASFILDFSRSSFMTKSTLQLSHMICKFISLHTWEHRVIACLYIRHYIPQVMVSSKGIKLIENPF